MMDTFHDSSGKDPAVTVRKLRKRAFFRLRRRPLSRL